MKNGDNAVRVHWRRIIVDVLVGASTVVVAFALISAITDAPYALLIAIAGALIGIGLLIEPNGTAQPDMQTTARFDAPIVDAAGA